jgi:hypothetical protein
MPERVCVYVCVCWLCVCVCARACVCVQARDSYGNVVAHGGDRFVVSRSLRAKSLKLTQSNAPGGLEMVDVTMVVYIQNRTCVADMLTARCHIMRSPSVSWMNPFSAL